MRSLIRPCSWAVPVALCLGLTARAAPPADPAADEGQVVITLRPGAGVAASPVCVGHVASLSGGTPALRQQIAGLDLVERPRGGQPLSLTRELIACRIQVAGIDRGRFRMQGAPAVRVSPDVPVAEDDLLQAARDALLDKLAARPADVIVALAESPAVPQLALGEKDELRLQAEPREPVSAPGRLRVDVALLVNGERLRVVPVLLDVKVYQSVAVAARRIEAGEALGAENVRFERQPTDAAGSCLTAKDLAPGRKARRAIAAGQVVPAAAVEPLADNPILVRQRDLVKAVARVGTLRVTALAEVEQDGRAGDRIRVRNVDSKKEIVGRVVGRGLVEVEY